MCLYLKKENKKPKKYGFIVSSIKLNSNFLELCWVESEDPLWVDEPDAPNSYIVSVTTFAFGWFHKGQFENFLQTFSIIET